MRVNVYAEELTDRVEVVTKKVNGQEFTAVRFYMELPATVDGKQYSGPFIHHSGDDDSSAVTFWGKQRLHTLLQLALNALDRHYKKNPDSNDQTSVKSDMHKFENGQLHLTPLDTELMKILGNLGAEIYSQGYQIDVYDEAMKKIKSLFGIYIQQCSKTPHQLRVEEFMRKAEQELPEEPTVPSLKIRELRAKLILEECLETVDALGFATEIIIPQGSQTSGRPILIVKDAGPNLKEIADGCADISVVTIGTLSACGISDLELLEEVDRSNLSKFDLPSCPEHGGQLMLHEGNGVYKCDHIKEASRAGVIACGYTEQGPYCNADGKWIKGPQYQSADVDGVLEKQSKAKEHSNRCDGQPPEAAVNDPPKVQAEIRNPKSVIALERPYESIEKACQDGWSPMFNRSGLYMTESQLVKPLQLETEQEEGFSLPIAINLPTNSPIKCPNCDSMSYYTDGHHELICSVCQYIAPRL